LARQAFLWVAASRRAQGTAALTAKDAKDAKEKQEKGNRDSKGGVTVH
jgi:hypothetical protein